MDTRGVCWRKGLVARLSDSLRRDVPAATCRRKGPVDSATGRMQDTAAAWHAAAWRAARPAARPPWTPSPSGRSPPSSSRRSRSPSGCTGRRCATARAPAVRAGPCPKRRCGAAANGIAWSGGAARAGGPAVPSPLTASGSAVADVYFGWIVLWSVVDVAFVLGLAAAKIPRLTLTPGRAVLFILFLCVANDRAGGGLVGSALGALRRTVGRANAAELPPPAARPGVRSTTGRASCPAEPRRQRPASRVRYRPAHHRVLLRPPVLTRFAWQGHRGGRSRLQRHHARWAAVGPHHAAHRDRSRRTRRGRQYATTWRLLVSVQGPS